MHVLGQHAWHGHPTLPKTAYDPVTHFQLETVPVRHRCNGVQRLVKLGKILIRLQIALRVSVLAYGFADHAETNHSINLTLTTLNQAICRPGIRLVERTARPLRG